METDEKLELMASQLLEQQGRMLAMEAAIKMLMINHPDHRELHRHWSGIRTGGIDALMEKDAYRSNEAFRKGVNEQLASFATMLEALSGSGRR